MMDFVNGKDDNVYIYMKWKIRFMLETTNQPFVYQRATKPFTSFQHHGMVDPRRPSIVAGQARAVTSQAVRSNVFIIFFSWEKPWENHRKTVIRNG